MDNKLVSISLFLIYLLALKSIYAQVTDQTLHVNLERDNNFVGNTKIDSNSNENTKINNTDSQNPIDYIKNHYMITEYAKTLDKNLTHPECTHIKGIFSRIECKKKKSDLKSFFEGIGDSVIDAFKDTYEVIRHPLNTVKSISYAVEHPKLIYDNIYNSMEEKCKEHKAACSGELVGTLSLLLLPGPLLEGLAATSLAGGVKAIDGVDKVSKIGLVNRPSEEIYNEKDSHKEPDNTDENSKSSDNKQNEYNSESVLINKEEDKIQPISNIECKFDKIECMNYTNPKVSDKELNNDIKNRTLDNIITLIQDEGINGNHVSNTKRDSHKFDFQSYFANRISGPYEHRRSKFTPGFHWTSSLF